MNLGVIAVLCIFDVVFAVAVIIWNLTNKNKSVNNVEEVIEPTFNEQEEVVEEPTYEEPATEVYEEPTEEPVEETVIEEVEEQAEEIVEEPTEEYAEEVEEVIEEPVEEVAEEQVEEIAEEVVEQPEEVVDEVVIEPTEKEEIIRLTFAEKLLSMDDNVQGYYNAICNFFASYRNINRRVSNACVSFRWGRELVAKMTVRGKTMKLHLALNLNDYDEALYFQKDYSDVKAYVEVPFTVKVKSDRGLKRALELVAALCVEKGVEQKTRYNEIDAIAEIREKYQG